MPVDIQALALRALAIQLMDRSRHPVSIGLQRGVFERIGALPGQAGVHEQGCCWRAAYNRRCKLTCGLAATSVKA